MKRKRLKDAAHEARRTFTKAKQVNGAIDREERIWEDLSDKEQRLVNETLSGRHRRLAH